MSEINPREWMRVICGNEVTLETDCDVYDRVVIHNSNGDYVLQNEQAYWLCSDSQDNRYLYVRCVNTHLPSVRNSIKQPWDRWLAPGVDTLEDGTLLKPHCGAPAAKLVSVESVIDDEVPYVMVLFSLHDQAS